MIIRIHLLSKFRVPSQNINTVSREGTRKIMAGVIFLNKNIIKLEMEVHATCKVFEESNNKYYECIIVNRKYMRVGGRKWGDCEYSLDCEGTKYII